MRQYGYENFDFEVLETLYIDDIKIVNAQEQFWVKQLDTYCGHGKGYNMDLGGCQPEHSKVVSKEEIVDIKNMLKQKTPFIDIQKKFQISAALFRPLIMGYITGMNKKIILFANIIKTMKIMTNLLTY